MTQKVIQSLQILNLHQLRPYSSVEAIGGFSFTCFSVFGPFGQSVEFFLILGPENTKGNSKTSTS